MVSSTNSVLILFINARPYATEEAMMKEMYVIGGQKGITDPTQDKHTQARGWAAQHRTEHKIEPLKHRYL